MKFDEAMLAIKRRQQERKVEEFKTKEQLAEVIRKKKQSLATRMEQHYLKQIETPMLLEQKKILEEKRSMKKPLDPSEFKTHLNNYQIF
jgi:hypothetical protein